jgi:micrococcal nuclease
MRRPLLLIATLLIAKNVHSTGAWTGKILQIVDGDTVRVQPDAGGRPRKIRIEGIDAPEICQPGGRRARQALEARLLRRQVQVITRTTDDYGRGVGRITLDGDDVGRWMVAQGHAWSYRFRNNDGPYAAEQAQARRQRRGVFAQVTAERPRDFRQRHGPCPQPHPSR